jgi:DNA helicase IV
MDQIQKDLLRSHAQKHIGVVQGHVKEERARIVGQSAELSEIIKGASEKGSHDEENTDIEKILLYEKGDRVEELLRLYQSPYFTKCVVRFDGQKEDQVLYFGKFAFYPDTISSWTTPIAQLRFEPPGRFTLKNFEDLPIMGTLKYKEQYMIVNGHIVFMASEGEGHPRELVYQERLTRKKSDFSLPEIVEQMEKAQDEVIRAHWKGSFLISGPAGSGKTTLALHRVAYLAQSPETESLFPTDKVIVFVQDASTKAYFGNLLPELGIRRVTITTFEEWIISTLGLHGVTYIRRYGRTEEERDLYEYRKNAALNSVDFEEIARLHEHLLLRHVYDILEQVYRETFPPELFQLFRLQTKDRVLDRFDLSALGLFTHAKEGGLMQDVPEYTYVRKMEYKKSFKRVPLNYSLIIVDEAENFLSEQITLILSTLSKKTKAVLYVGDLAQQTLPYTIRNWNAVGETFGAGRKVVLQKVYRNTRQILEYINGAGFTVDVPSELAQGAAVAEFVVSEDEEFEQVTAMIAGSRAGVIGILSKDESYLEWYKAQFKDDPRVKVLTINEAQGVEFDAVYLVGVDRKSFVPQMHEAAYFKEYTKVNHDLLYVALTRAMNELYVFGREPLREIVAALG